VLMIDPREFRETLVRYSPPYGRGRRRSKKVMLSLSDGEMAQLVKIASHVGHPPAEVARLLVVVGALAMENNGKEGKAV